MPPPHLPLSHPQALQVLLWLEMRNLGWGLEANSYIPGAGVAGFWNAPLWTPWPRVNGAWGTNTVTQGLACSWVDPSSVPPSEAGLL